MEATITTTDSAAVAQTPKTTTVENLKAAIIGETTASAKYAEFYKKALEAVKAKSDKNLAKEYYVCPVCGNTYEDGNVENDCSFCLTPKAKFMEVK